MERQLIWTVKSLGIKSRKRLSELSEREDLFDTSSIDTKSDDYAKVLYSFNKAKRTGCKIITYIDENYPTRLKTVSQPPPVLFVRGNDKILTDTVYAGIVGARIADDYGIRMAENIAMEIGQTGAGIISGGARGIDAAAHRGAIRANAPTIAVLGSGLDRPYPEDNIPLFKQITENGGAVISEFLFGTGPLGWNFPRRNRIISGLSSALVVVRAGHRSGSLITATQALSQGLTVFSVPGNIDDKLSQGTNELIRDGAIPLLTAMDVVDELIALEPDFFVREKERGTEREESPITVKENDRPKFEGLSEYEEELVNIIYSGANTLEMMEERVSFEPSRLTALLGMMEIKGIITKGSDKKYKLNTGGGC